MNSDSWIAKRVWFSKTGRARYISHLDLNRCMGRAVHKARVPLWYTEGFNPHPFMTFALPLSLGIDGVRESMDIRLLEDVPKETLLEGINSGLPADIRVFDVTSPVMKPGQIAFASYEITALPEGMTAAEGKAAMEALLARETVLMEKRSKSGMQAVDLRPDLDLRDLRTEGDAVRCTAVLPAGSARNRNPQLLFAALERYCGARFTAQIVRTGLYDGQGAAFA